MANAGTLTIRVEADTTDVDRGLKRTRKEMRDTEVEAARLNRNAARYQAAGSAIGGAVTAVRLARRGSTAGRFARGVAGFGLRRALLLGGLGLGAAGLGGGLLGALLGRGRNRAAGGGNNQEQEALIYLQQIATASSRSMRSLDEIEAQQKATKDILNRGARFQQIRQQRLGTGITPGQVNALAVMQDYADVANGYREAWRRERATSFTEIQNLRTQLGGMYSQFRLWMRNLERQTIGVSRTRPLTIMDRVRAFSSLITTGSPSAMNRAAGRTSADTVDDTGRQVRQAAEFTMMQLRARGPASVMTPAMTVRAGTESEYQLRVQMQRQEMQGQET